MQKEPLPFVLMFMHYSVTLSLFDLRLFVWQDLLGTGDSKADWGLERQGGEGRGW